MPRYNINTTIMFQAVIMNVMVKYMIEVMTMDTVIRGIVQNVHGLMQIVKILVSGGDKNVDSDIIHVAKMKVRLLGQPLYFDANAASLN